MELTKPRRIGNTIKGDVPYRFRLTAQKIGYQFNYPISVFTEHEVKPLTNKLRIRQVLHNRNPY